jgi:hypothetical protein
MPTGSPGCAPIDQQTVQALLSMRVRPVSATVHHPLISVLVDPTLLIVAMSIDSPVHARCIWKRSLC